MIRVSASHLKATVVSTTISCLMLLQCRLLHRAERKRGINEPREYMMAVGMELRLLCRGL